MPRRALRRLWPYAVAVLATTSATVLIRMPAVATTPNTAIMVVFFAILGAAWYGGMGPGLLVTGLFALMTMPGTFAPRQTVRFAMFVTGGETISLVVESLHAARRRAEAATRQAHDHLDRLSRSEGRLRLLIDSARDYAIFTTDEGGRITGWNAGAERVLGYTEAEALGRNMDTFFTPDDRRDGVPGAVLKSASEEGRLGGERWLTRRDGTRFWASGVVTALSAGGGQGLSVVLRDVTERKLAEDERARLLADERAARREAEAANQAKNRFLAVLSHELRTPLTPVLATVTALLDVPGTPLELRTTLELIRRSVELEARLIDDLLDVSRVAHGKLHLNREVVDTHELVRQTLGICRSDMNGQRTRLELDLDAPRPHVEADPSRLQQVLWNLIKNAVKFTPDGGTLAVRTRNEGTPGAGERLVLEVADSGVGIEPEVLPRVFAAFEQGEESTTRRFGGLGLGLAISHAVVEAHGGRLSAASPGRGRGATFTVELEAVAPAATRPKPIAAPAAEPVPVAGPVPPRRALRILLVEDDRPSLRVMSRLLQQREHTVTTADTLSSALEVGEREDFDLIISDIGLPDGTGWDLMRRLRPRGPVKAIALSGFGMDEDILRSREAGFLEHLTKPVNFQKLEATIQRVTAGLTDGGTPTP